MPRYTPWIWSPPHGKHYSYYMADDDKTILDTMWSGPTGAQDKGNIVQPSDQTPQIQSNIVSNNNYPQANHTIPRTTPATAANYQYTSPEDGTGANYTHGQQVDDLGDAYQASHEQIQSNAAGGDDYPGQDKGKRIDSGQYSALAGQLQSLDIASEPSNTQYTNLAYPSSSSSSAYQSHGGTTAQYPTALRLPTQQASGSYQMTSQSQRSGNTHYTERAHGQGSTNTRRYVQPSQTVNSARGQEHAMVSSQAPTQTSTTQNTYYPEPPAERSTVVSLPGDVQAHIGFKERRYIQTGTEPEYYERLDSRFRRVAKHHHAAFFIPGRVFKMLWTEPAGQANPGKTRNSTHFSTVWLGEQAWSEIRYFVVVRNKGTFSQCIPIQTYGRKGATKVGLNVKDHGIIHTSEKAPNLLPGEHITKYSIQVKPTLKEILEPESRINYGKAYAVEHNVKVLDIGMVVENHRYLIAQFFDLAMTGQ